MSFSVRSPSSPSSSFPECGNRYCRESKLDQELQTAAAPCPVWKSFRVSSNKRAGGTSRRRIPDAAIGAAAIRRDLEVQFGGETCRAKHPHRDLHGIAFLDRRSGVAFALGYVSHARRVVPDRKVSDVVIKRIDCEIASPDILLNGSVNVVAKNSTAIGLFTMLMFGGRRGAKGYDFDNLPSKVDVSQAKAAPDQPAVSKQEPEPAPGRASVATSKSFGCSSSSKSRTPPPTRNAW